MHRLLKRQIKRTLGKDFELESLDEEMKKLFLNISDTYDEYDKECRFMENIVDLNSTELNIAHKLIEQKNKNLKNILDEKSKLLENRIEENRDIELTLKQYKQAMDSTLLISKFDLDGVTTFVNDNLCKISGYTPEELIGKKQTIVSDSLDLKNCITTNTKNRQIWSGHVESLTKRKERYCLNVVIFALTDKDNNITEFMSISQDITQLEMARQKAENLDKAKSEFLANMSHELRTPLNAIIGFSQILMHSKNIPEKLRNFIEKINTSGDSLLKLINSILDFSKIEAGQMKLEKVHFNIKDIITTVLNQQELKATEKGIKLVVNCDTKSCSTFNGDSLKISQILTNLITNAIKFTDNGEVKLSISKLHKNRYRFEIKDTGIGLNKEQQNKLFKAFSQADASTTRKYGGTGLGLTISKKFIEMMHGKIWIESEVGVGSSFIFEIELEEIIDTDINQEEQESTIQNNLQKLQGKKVLIAEDNKTNQLLIISLLEDTEVDIDIANNGQEAVDKFNTNSYDIILMDLQMPVMNGYEATQTIRKIDKNIPIIALTANVLKEDREKTNTIGMNEHLNKPIDVNKLYSILLKYTNIS